MESRKIFINLWRSFCVEMTTKAKAKHLLGVGLKIIGALVLLYFFICSLDLLANAFRLSAGRTAGISFLFLNLN
jgi:hypothetical protein